MLEEPVVRWRSGFHGAQDGLLELGQLVAQLPVHLLDLAFVESFGLPDIDDLLQTATVLVVELVDVAGAFLKSGVDLGRSFTHSWLVELMLVWRVVDLVTNLVVVLLNSRVEESVRSGHHLLVWTVQNESICFVDRALLGHGGLVDILCDRLLSWATSQRLLQDLQSSTSAPTKSWGLFLV